MESMVTPREMLSEFKLVIRRRKWLILGVFVLVVAGVCGYIWMKYPLYKSTALILVHENPRQQLILFHDIATPAQPSLQVNPAKNLIEISRSTELARQIVEKFGLDKRVERRAEAPQTVREKFWYWFYAGLDTPFDFLEFLGLMEDPGHRYEYDAIRLLLDDRQDIQYINGTELVKLSVWEEDPILASEIANHLAELLIEKTVSMSQSKASVAYGFTKERAEIAQQELDQIEDKLTGAKTEQNLIDLKLQQQLKLSRIDQARKDYDKAIEEEQSLLERLAELRRQLQSVAQRIPSSTVVAHNPLISELKLSQYRTEMELASRESELGNSNPEIGGLRAKVGRVEGQLAAEDQTIIQSETTSVNPLYQQLESQIADTEIELKACAARRTVLQEQLKVLQNELLAMPDKEALLHDLERRNKIQEDLYVNLENKLAELEVQQLNRLSEFDIRIIDDAYLPNNASPAWPSWKTSLLIVIPIALVLGLLVAFLVNYFDESYIAPAPLERDLGAPVLGCVPQVRFRRMSRFIQGARHDG